MEKLSHFGSWADLGIVIREAKLQQHSKTIAKFSQEFSLPIYGSDLESVRRGIPFYFGMSESLTGRQTALHGLQILQNEDKLVCEYPIMPLKEEYKLYINEETAKLFLAGKNLSLLQDDVIFI